MVKILFKEKRQRRYESLIRKGYARKVARRLSKEAWLPHRFEVLRREGFSHREAKQLSRIAFKNRPLKAIRQDIKAGVMADYPDAWAMYRAYRADLIEKREYIPPPKKKRPGRIDKGDVAKQKARYQAKAERRKADKAKGYISTQYDFEGKRIGGIRFDEKTGKFTHEIEG